ncbi:GNAT family N-acetyltransferase [Caulobacter sp. S45]|uniref:GNAT family N-acetyltransferase n=1 Tax=Caulobacter sp. S45 TaxID=1641861 RepID=UPI00157617D0|nr:GNAT family N-acetyltransferase [Caulobacter sp. S45]
MPEIILRRAGPADAERLAQLGLQTFRETFLEGFAIPYPAADLEAFLAANYTPAVFERKLADPLQATWIAEGDGGALAYANAGPCHLPHPDVRPGHLELNRLYVLCFAQGLGLGRRLLDTALDWMEEQGPGPLWLGVWSGNLKAQSLYARRGFRRVGDYEFPVGEWRDHEFIFRRGD